MEVSKEKMKKGKFAILKNFAKGVNATHINIRKNQNTSVKMKKNSLSQQQGNVFFTIYTYCLLYTSPSPRDGLLSRMPSSA